MFSVHLSANYFSDLKSPKKSVVSKKAVASAWRRFARFLSQNTVDMAWLNAISHHYNYYYHAHIQINLVRLSLSLLWKKCTRIKKQRRRKSYNWVNHSTTVYLEKKISFLRIHDINSTSSLITIRPHHDNYPSFSWHVQLKIHPVNHVKWSQNFEPFSWQNSFMFYVTSCYSVKTFRRRCFENICNICNIFNIWNI